MPVVRRAAHCRRACTVGTASLLHSVGRPPKRCLSTFRLPSLRDGRGMVPGWWISRSVSAHVSTSPPRMTNIGGLVRKAQSRLNFITPCGPTRRPPPWNVGTGTHAGAFHTTVWAVDTSHPWAGPIRRCDLGPIKFLSGRAWTSRMATRTNFPTLLPFRLRTRWRLFGTRKQGRCRTWTAMYWLTYTAWLRRGTRRLFTFRTVRGRLLHHCGKPFYSCRGAVACQRLPALLLAAAYLAILCFIFFAGTVSIAGTVSHSPGTCT